jgi:EAL domain-containing protein (putative c-di-GMP-specific phosphodiesterase class I)
MSMAFIGFCRIPETKKALNFKSLLDDFGLGWIGWRRLRELNI